MVLICDNYCIEYSAILPNIRLFLGEHASVGGKQKLPAVRGIDFFFFMLNFFVSLLCVEKAQPLHNVESDGGRG